MPRGPLGGPRPLANDNVEVSLSVFIERSDRSFTSYKAKEKWAEVRSDDIIGQIPEDNIQINKAGGDEDELDIRLEEHFDRTQELTPDYLDKKKSEFADSIGTSKSNIAFKMNIVIPMSE